MVIKNHIAYRLLTDDILWMEMLESQYPNLIDQFDKSKEVPDSAMGLYHCLMNKDNKSYIISKSVIENLDMLKINKDGDHFNWSVFKDLRNQKVTFIFQDGTALRMIVSEETIWFCHIKFNLDKGQDNNGHMYWVMFYFNRQTGELCDHFNHSDVKEMEEFIYKFLCFFYLTGNDEIIIPAGKVHGTRKTGKISNDLPFSVTLVNSRWNTTIIRTEAFGVRGHFRVQRKGISRQDYEVIFIEPYEKTGYVRSASAGFHKAKLLKDF